MDFAEALVGMLNGFIGFMGLCSAILVAYHVGVTNIVIPNNTSNYVLIFNIVLWAVVSLKCTDLLFQGVDTIIELAKNKHKKRRKK